MIPTISKDVRCLICGRPVGINLVNPGLWCNGNHAYMEAERKRLEKCVILLDQGAEMMKLCYNTVIDQGWRLAVPLDKLITVD